jgi:hypothetical protein
MAHTSAAKQAKEVRSLLSDHEKRTSKAFKWVYCLNLCAFMLLREFEKEIRDRIKVGLKQLANIKKRKVGPVG